MIPAAMMSQRIMGVMAHWREYMCKSLRDREDIGEFLTLSTLVQRGKLFRPSHLYTGEVKEDKPLPKI
jgi:citrate synthase